MTKRIAIIGTVGLPAKYGGFETLTENLTGYLGGDFEITVFCSSKSYAQKAKSCNNARLLYLPFHANGVQSILYDIVSIFKSLQFADTLLILGVSGCVILPLINMIKGGKKIIVNIDGLEWKRDKWNTIARLFLKYSEKSAVKYADEVITDNTVIQEYVQKEYGAKSSMVAYGGDHAAGRTLTAETRKKHALSFPEYAFSVCRIEPENNIHVILEAFSQIDYPLVFVGNWLNSGYGKELKQKYSRVADILLIDSVYDQDELDQLRSNASVYIHGHSAGGTNPSLVEAMNLGLPVIAYDVQYNRATTGNMALYFSTAEELRSLIRAKNHLLGEIGVSLKMLALQRYTWKIISEQYREALLRN